MFFCIDIFLESNVVFAFEERVLDMMIGSALMTYDERPRHQLLHKTCQW
jgi:hypothetical protein